MLEPERISARVATALESKDTELWLSPVSIWEVIILRQKRKIGLSGDIETWLDEALKKRPFRQAPLNFEVAREMGRLKLHHRDPADGFLAATAKVFDLTLVTADEQLLKVRGIRMLANR
jgi:PIN domain nuclease of toxin-antitoxin system